MDKHHDLNPTVAQKARALCRKITVAHALDAEIQEELYGHIEDKLIGYVRGEIPVSEDDAMHLVSEHFGDPATIKSLFRDVHTTEVAVSQGRRLSAAALVTFGIMYAGTATMSLITIADRYIAALRTGSEETVMMTTGESLLRY